jgi:hypothetical protein
MGAAASGPQYNIKQFDWENPNSIDFILSRREAQVNEVDRIVTSKTLRKLLKTVLNEDIIMLRSITGRKSRSATRSASKSASKSATRSVNGSRAKRLAKFGLTEEVLKEAGIPLNEFDSASNTEIEEMLAGNT